MIVESSIPAEIDTSCSIAFWRRYRVRLHVTPKGTSAPQSVDLEGLELETPRIQQLPRLHHHSRLGSRNSRKWPGYTEQRWQPSRPMSDYHFAPRRIAEEPEGTVINHFSQPIPTTPIAHAKFLSAPATAPPATPILRPEAATPAQLND